MEFSTKESLLSQPFWVLLPLFLGSLSTFKLLFSLLQWTYIYLIRPGKNLKSYGQWAVVTGPTDGIGKAMAFELARKGLNLVLVGRNPNKLSQVSSQIRSEISPRVEIRSVVIDFSSDLDQGVALLRETIKNIDVGILINNAGLSQIKPKFFHEIEERAWMDMIRVNLLAPTVVTSVVLPLMVERRRGAVVNVGSGSTVVVPSFPLYSVYAGTKGYIKHISKSLHAEYKNSGIVVQCQVPCFVVTKITPGLKTSIFSPSPSQYAGPAVKSIGYEPLIIPYWPHCLQYLLSRLCPAEFILDRLSLKTALYWRKKTANGQ